MDCNMETDPRIKTYSPLAERINIASHALGLMLSLVALLLLLRHPDIEGQFKATVSFGVFGLSLVVLYLASTIYHASTTPAIRIRMRVVDHAVIYVLIAGTYTPFTLITLHSTLGRSLFFISWGLALSGIALKLFFTGRFKVLSTIMYVVMGWLIVFAIKPLMANLSEEGVFWLVLGGLSYTLGAVIYAIKSIKFNHAIFHVFVLSGSICHFISVYFYLLA